ncbi:MAG: hypothetical protein HXL58_03040 [Solobacterium sp.]|nr:hypothetical protein [Solobacterium sp.]
MLKQILTFNQLQMTNPLSAGQFVLWHALLNVCNDCGKKEWFTVANLRLELFTGLSRQGVDKARNTLKELGFIEYKPNGTKATSYKINILYKDELQTSSQVGSQASSQASSQVGSQVVDKSVANQWSSSLQNSRTLYKEKKSKEKKSNNNILDNVSEKQFEELWGIYPRKEKKSIAQKAYAKALEKGVTHSTIEKGLLSYIDYIEKNGIEHRFIKQGGTWFSQESWNDEYKSNYKTSIPYPSYKKGYIEPIPDWLIKDIEAERKVGV